MIILKTILKKNFNPIKLFNNYFYSIPIILNNYTIKPIKIELNEDDLRETFVKGSGNGGQAINKTNSNVELVHIPTGIRLQCQKTRSQSENRKIARKMMMAKLDEHYNGNKSKKALKIQKLKKQKAKARKRSLEKYSKDDAEDDSTIKQQDIEVEEHINKNL